MTNIEKNSAIALMLGAKEDVWYPPNKDYNSTGIYYEMQNQQYFPNGHKHCGDSMLKYDSDANWQDKVLTFVEKLGFEISINTWYGANKENTLEVPECCVDICFKNSIRRAVPKRFHFPTRKQAIFEALYEFSQWYKQQKP